MALAGTLSLLFVSWAVLATTTFASTCSGPKVLKVKLFEQGKILHDVTRVFGLSSVAWKKGEGNVLTSVLTKTDDPDSKFSGYLSGFAVCSSDIIRTEVLTLEFTDSEGDGSLKGSRLFLYGLLNMENRMASQDYAVIGGTGKLIGANGVLTFIPVPNCYGCRWIEGTAFVPDLACLADAETNTLLTV